jgi:hypothetical protein
MRRFTQIIVMAGLTTAALTGNAAAQDLQSPDARATAPVTAPTIDLRSPDAKASEPRGPSVSSDVAQGNALQDKRSPDARGNALQDKRSPDAHDRSGVRTYTPGAIPSPRVVSVPANGFEWGDAGIGAAAMLGLVALCGGMMLVVSSRRRERRLPRAIG